MEFDQADGVVTVHPVPSPVPSKAANTSAECFFADLGANEAPVLNEASSALVGGGFKYFYVKLLLRMVLTH